MSGKTFKDKSIRKSSILADDSEQETIPRRTRPEKLAQHFLRVKISFSFLLFLLLSFIFFLLFYFLPFSITAFYSLFLFFLRIIFIALFLIIKICNHKSLLQL